VPDDTRVPVKSDVDIVVARQEGRALAARLGLSARDVTLVATAISEVARNILLYAKQGEIILRMVEHDDERGLVVIARDDGPGIPDITLALQDGYSTSKGLGLGLPGARRLMDEFEIVSEVGKGTTVTMKKWAR
jgi:serine/threonine-protein kinase RsbT